MVEAQPQHILAQRGRIPQKWKVLISVIFGLFMVILDTTVVNVAFQTLRTEFGASLNDAQWIISIYVLSLGISTPLAGFLSDRFGIKEIYLAGLFNFYPWLILMWIVPKPAFYDRGTYTPRFRWRYFATPGYGFAA